MEYTPIFLGLMGCLGILLHNLVKMDTINRAASGTINLRKYLMVERFSILISLIVVLICVFCSHEIKQLYDAGLWLGLGFVGVGYLAQSLLVKAIGKFKKITN